MTADDVMSGAAGVSAAELGDAVLRDRYVDLDDVRLHVVESGRGRLVLFLHGFPEFWYAWRQYLLSFGTGFHAAAPDMRGYNLSSKPAGLEPYRLRCLVGDVRGLVGALGHERAVLVGHDWGGAVAWAAALTDPALFERMVIVNAPHPAIFARLLESHAAQIAASQYMTDFLDPGTEARLLADDAAEMARWITTWGIKRGFMTAEDDHRYRRAWQVPGAMTAMLAYYRNRALARKPDGVLRVEVPTHVVWGMKDRALTPANLDGLSEHVADLSVDRVGGASHWVPHERPDRVEAAVRWAVGEGARPGMSE